MDITNKKKKNRLTIINNHWGIAIHFFFGSFHNNNEKKPVFMFEIWFGCVVFHLEQKKSSAHHQTPSKSDIGRNEKKKKRKTNICGVCE